MGRMRNPSLSLHGIEGAFCELDVLIKRVFFLAKMNVAAPGSKTVIPCCVKGEFFSS